MKQHCPFVFDYLLTLILQCGASNILEYFTTELTNVITMKNRKPFWSTNYRNHLPSLNGRLTSSQFLPIQSTPHSQ